MRTNNTFKAFKSLVFGAFLSAIFASVSLAKSYDELPQHVQLKDAKGTIVEIFSYQCIHCYNHFRAKTMALLGQKFPNMIFHEWQVAQMGEYGAQMDKILAFAHALDLRDGLDSVLSENSYTNKILKAYFEATFKHRFRFSDEGQFYSIALAIFNEMHKITVNDIQNYALSESGKAYLAKSAQAYEVARINGTPGFIINGKYLLDMSKINSPDDLQKVVSELVDKY